MRVRHDLVNVLGFVIHADAIAHSLAISAFFSGEDQVAPHGNGETAYYPVAYPIFLNLMNLPDLEMGDPGGGSGREQGGRGTPHQHHALLAHHQSQAIYTIQYTPPLLTVTLRRTSSPPSSPQCQRVSLFLLEQPSLSSLDWPLCLLGWVTTPPTTSPCHQDIRYLLSL